MKNVISLSSKIILFYHIKHNGIFKKKKKERKSKNGVSADKKKGSFKNDQWCSYNVTFHFFLLLLQSSILADDVKFKWVLFDNWSLLLWFIFLTE